MTTCFMLSSENAYDIIQCSTSSSMFTTKMILRIEKRHSNKR